jgi:hypothetical protein
MSQKTTNPILRQHKFLSTSPAHKYTQQKLLTVRIKDELKYLYSKKQQRNQQVYHLQLALANTWHNMWPHIQHTIENKLRQKISSNTKLQTVNY